MKKFIHNIAILFMIGTYSCSPTDPNKEVDEGSVKNDIYQSEALGWSMEIPNDWDIISKEKMDKNSERGLEKVEQAGYDIDASSLKHLISFKKNMFNIFQSTTEPFKLDYEGQWEDNTQNVKNILFETFKAQKIKIDTASSSAKIDGLEFDLFLITVYGASGKVVLNQELYSRHINDHQFSVNINYNNEKDRAVMTDVWMNSKFEKQIKP